MKDNGIDGLRSRFVTYDQLGHWIVLEEMKDLSVWIESCVPHIKGVDQRHFAVQNIIQDSRFLQSGRGLGQTGPDHHMKLNLFSVSCYSFVCVLSRRECTSRRSVV